MRCSVGSRDGMMSIVSFPSRWILVHLRHKLLFEREQKQAANKTSNY